MDEKDLDAFTEAFRAALKNITSANKEEVQKEVQIREAPKQEQPKQEPQIPINNHVTEAPKQVSTSNINEVVNKIPKPKSVKEVMDELNEIYHPTTHDFLSCEVCKPLFENEVKNMGYDVQEKNGVITIAPKKVIKK